MNSPEAPDSIDKLLREQDSHISDDGFTKRVIAALPRRRPSFPRMILFAVAISGAVVAAFFMHWHSLPPLDFTQVFAPDSQVLRAWIPVLAVGVVLGSALLAALRREN